MTEKQETEKIESATTPNVTPDIQGILDDAFLASVRLTPEYKLGILEARLQKNVEQVPEVRRQMIPYAESFIALLKKNFPELVPTQVRLGFDYSTQGPVALFVFASSARDQIKTLRDSARSLERAFWDSRKTEGMIWVLATDKPDQQSLETNFPISRKLPV